MIQKLASYLLVVELVLSFLVTLASWTASMVGFPVANLFGEEGLRWLCLHLDQLIIPPHMGIFLMVLITLGAMRLSGLVQRHFTPTRPRLSALLLELVLLLLIFLPILLNYTPLLSVTGSVQNSPWSALFPYAMLSATWLVSLFYAAQNDTLDSAHLLLDMLTYGLQRYALLIPVFMLANFLCGITFYVLLPYIPLQIYSSLW